MILRADRLRPSTKTSKFYRLLFSLREFSSYAEAAREAGFPSMAAGTMSERLMRHFRELSQPMQAKFIVSLKVADGSLALSTLTSRLETMSYFDSKRRDQADRLRALLFTSGTYTAGPVAPQKVETPEVEPPKKSWVLPGMMADLRSGWKWGRRKGRGRNTPAVALEIISPEEAARRLKLENEKGE
jgi:hypothetical protein